MPSDWQLVESIEKLRRGSIQVILAIVTIFTVVEYIEGLHYIEGEWNTWTYISSLMYFVAGMLSILTAILVGYYGRIDEPKQTRRWVIWAMVGIAFIFFTCDEALTIHESLGAMVDRSLPWVKHIYPGHFDNVIILMYVVGALVYARTLMEELRRSPKARSYFILGFILIGSAALTDLAPKVLVIRYLPFAESEELFEMYAGFAFAASFICTSASVLTKIAERLIRSMKVESDGEVAREIEAEINAIDSSQQQG